MAQAQSGREVSLFSALLLILFVVLILFTDSAPRVAARRRGFLVIRQFRKYVPTRFHNSIQRGFNNLSPGIPLRTCVIIRTWLLIRGLAFFRFACYNTGRVTGVVLLT